MGGGGGIVGWQGDGGVAGLTFRLDGV